MTDVRMRSMRISRGVRGWLALLLCVGVALFTITLWGTPAFARPAWTPAVTPTQECTASKRNPDEAPAVARLGTGTEHIALVPSGIRLERSRGPREGATRNVALADHGTFAATARSTAVHAVGPRATWPSASPTRVRSFLMVFLI